jgi:hypothetical protein
VEVCNGMRLLTPLWSRKPTICVVRHVPTDLWSLRFRPPLCTAGRFLEQRVMPWVHRHNLVLTVSASTALALESLGVPRERTRMLTNGAAPVCSPVLRRSSPRHGLRWHSTRRRAALGEAARRGGARLRWSTAVRHFSAVIDEAADGAR